MPVRIPAGCQKFRPATLPLGVLIFAAGMVGIFVQKLAMQGFHAYANLFKFFVSFNFAWAVFWSWGFSLFFTMAISETGVYGHSAWGLRCFVGWKDITAAKTLRLANLKWLRIYSANGQVTWLALFPVGKSQFHREIVRHAPPDSPVLPFLSNF